MTPAELSSEKMDWQTPDYFLDLVRAVAPIALDPCAPVDGNPTGAAVTIRQGPVSCGLRADWRAITTGRDGLAFVNPPYGAHLGGDIDPDYRIMRKPKGEIGRGRGWARKIIAETGIDRLVLVPARTDAEWWAELFDASDERLLWRSPKLGARIKFRDASTGRLVTGNTSASTVFFLGKRPEDYSNRSATQLYFREVFGPHGKLVLPAVRP